MSIVSFDFDGVLHQTVKIDRYTPEGEPFCYGPLNDDYTLWKNLQISPLILQQMEEEIAQGNVLVIVSAREKQFGQYALLHLEKIGIRNRFRTIQFGCKDKAAVLKELGAVRHYEDSLKHVEKIRAEGIEVIQIYPLSARIFEP